MDAKKLIWDAVVKAATALLFKALPALGWGPIGLIVGTVIGIFTDLLYDAIKGYIDHEGIASRNQELRRLYDDASVKLKIIAQGKGLGSKEYLEARRANVDRLAHLVRFA